MRRFIPLVLFGALAVAPCVSAAQQFTRPGSIAKLNDPIVLDDAKLFQDRFVKVGDDMFIAGQPTERGLRELKAQGVTTVVNLRTPEEMEKVGFDEAALVKELGMRYVHLPMRGTKELPYSPERLAEFSKAVNETNGKVLLHCTVAWRASHLWAAYLIQERGIPVEQALTHTRAINLMDTHRMGTNGRQPVEDFLNRTLPTLGHPPMPH